MTLVGPMTLKESLQIRNNRLSVPVTVSGIHSHSKTNKYMIMYNLPSSKGTMTRTLTLQVTRNRQHDTSRPSVQPNHQDYVSTDLVRELRVPSDVDDIAIQEALMKLFNPQVQDQVRDQTKSVPVEGQASRAKSSVSDQALKASDSVRDQSSSVQSSSYQLESESKPSSSV